MKARKLITALVVGLSVFASRVEAKTVLYTEYLTTNTYADAFYKSAPGRGASPGITFTRTDNLATSGYLYNYAFTCDYHGTGITRYALVRALQAGNALSLPASYTRYSDVRRRRYYSKNQVGDEAFDVHSLDATSSAKLEAIVLANNLDSQPDLAIALPMYQDCHLDYEFNLSYDLAGGSGEGFAAITFVNETTLPSTSPTRRGYRFAGWRGSNGKSYAPGARLEFGPSDADVTLTAQWLANAYTVNFVKNDSGASGTMQPQAFTYGTPARLNACGFSFPGWEFAGWATSATGPVAYADGANVSDLTDVHGGTVPLYAVWQPGQIVVEFDAAGGSASPASNTVTYLGTYGELPTATRSASTNPYGCATRYVFEGWYYGEQRITSGSQVQATGRHKLVAKWSAWTTYRISFDLAGGSGTGFSAFTFENGTTLTSAKPTRTGYDFGGWQGSDGNAYAPGAVLNFGQSGRDVTLTARWSAHTYTVNFVPNETGVTGSMSPQVFAYGATNRLPTCGFSLTGYDFGGWATSPKGPVAYADGASVSSLTAVDGATVSLYAVWQPCQMTVTFDADGGSVSPASTTVTYLGTYGELPTPTRSSSTNPYGCTTRYVFEGWYLGGAVVTSGTQVRETGRHTLIARWSSWTKYTVNFDLAGGSGAGFSAVTFENATTLPSASPARTGFDFEYWLGNDGRSYRPGDALDFGSSGRDLTLTARWAAHAYTVNFVPNETGVTGSMSPQEFYYGETNRLRSCGFMLAGYAFRGWAMAPAGPVAYADGAKVADLTAVDGGEVFLYALWEHGAVTVEFNAANGKDNPPSKTVKYQETYGELPEVTRDSFVSDGYTTAYAFEGWYHGDRLVTSDSQVLATSRHTLIAHWSQVTTGNLYTVTFDPAGGEVAPGAKSFRRGDSYADLPVPTREYHDFTDWCGEHGVAVRNGDTVRLTSNVTFVAQWRQRTFELTLDAQGGSVSPAKVACTEGRNFPPLAAPVRSGFAFAGWWTAADGAGEQVTTNVFATGEITTVYARWKSAAPAGQCAVTFDFGGALGTVVSNYTVGATLGGFPAAPENPGRSVKWWYADGSARPLSADAVVDGAMTVRARWTVDALNALTGLDDVAFETAGEAEWREETEPAARYGDRVTLRSGWPLVNFGDQSTLRMYVPGPGTLSFHWAMDGIDAGLAQTYFEFYRDGARIAAKCGTLLDWDAQAESVRVADSFAWNYCWAENDPLTLDRAWVSALAWTPDAASSSIEPWATDPVRTNLVITTGGSADWTMATNDDATASGVVSPAGLGHGSVSWLKAVTPAGPGELTFRWRVDCERGYTAADGSYVKTDYLEFSDGLGHVEFIDGTVDGYLTVTVTNLSSAPMTCVWRYVKDGDVSVGADRAWLDGLAWTGFAGSPEPTEADRPQITAVAAEDGVFRVTFAADGRFKYELERSESLAPAAWTVFEPRQFLSPDADGVVSFEPTVEPGRPRMFYRVKVLKKD